MDMNQIEDVIKALSLGVASLAEGAAALVVGIAAIRALLWFVVSLARSLLGAAGADSPDEVPKEAIRLNLGRSLALALEFEVGADILKTVAAPDLNSLLLLAGIIILRTLLNYFLERELTAAAARRTGQITPAPVPAAPPPDLTHGP
jgi:uncharacterized membrane protein